MRRNFRRLVHFTALTKCGYLPAQRSPRARRPDCARGSLEARRGEMCIRLIHMQVRKHYRGWQSRQEVGPPGRWGGWVRVSRVMWVRRSWTWFGRSYLCSRLALGPLLCPDSSHESTSPSFKVLDSFLLGRSRSLEIGQQEAANLLVYKCTSHITP